MTVATSLRFLRENIQGLISKFQQTAFASFILHFPKVFANVVLQIIIILKQLSDFLFCSLVATRYCQQLFLLLIWMTAKPCNFSPC